MFLRILSLVIIAAGFITVFLAKGLVRKYKLDVKQKCNFEHEMNEEELNQYKFNKAVVNIKMLGLLIALPGLILMVIAFKR